MQNVDKRAALHVELCVASSNRRRASEKRCLHVSRTSGAICNIQTGKFFGEELKTGEKLAI